MLICRQRVCFKKSSFSSNKKPFVVRPSFLNGRPEKPSIIVSKSFLSVGSPPEILISSIPKSTRTEDMSINSFEERSAEEGKNSGVNGMQKKQRKLQTSVN